MSSSDVITLREIYLAKRRIASIIMRTPLVSSPLLSERVNASVYLKLEGLQETGSFKLRGAANCILALPEGERARGVIAVSTGNHGRAVAYVAQRLGTRAVVCLSAGVPEDKVAALRRLDAEVVVHGESYDEAAAKAAELQKERGLAFIHPFDDPRVIAGQGTIGLELLEELPEIDTAIVPLSGGGLLSGIALALKSADPAIRVVGVSMDRAPVMYRSLEAGRPIELPEEETIADALVGGIGLDNRYTFRLCRRYLDEAVLVSEEEIKAAMAFLLAEHHLVVEGGGAVGVAALLGGRVGGLGGEAAVILSGSNVELSLLLKVARKHLEKGSESDA